MSALGSSLTEADIDTGLAAGATASRLLWVSASAAPGGDGSAGHPFTTIQAAVNVATPGTAIMVEAGTYVENVKFPSNAGGTADAPIQLVSFDGQGAAKIIAADNSIATVKGLGVHDIVVKGFEIEGGLNGIQFSQSGKDFTHLVSNIVVQGNIISNTVQDGVKISQADGVKILDNTIAHTGGEGVDFVAVNNSIIARNDVSFVQGAAGIFAKGGSTNDLITANHVHDIIKDGIEIGGWTTDAYFRPGFDTYEAKDVTVSGNDVSAVGQRDVNVLGALHSAVEGNQLAANAVYGTAIGVSTGADKAMISAGIDIGGNVITGETHSLYYVDPSSGAVTFHDNAVSGSLGLAVGPEAAWASSEAQQVATAAGGAVPDPTQASSAPVPTAGTAIITGTNKSEVLVGTAEHNAIYAGGGSDYVYGGADSDTLDGGGGVDVMVGGSGDDTYVVSSAFDQIVELPGGGHDQIFSTLNTLRLANWANVEDITFTGTGGANILGNDLDNRIIGGVANDSIDGGAGADTLVGSAGDDVYFVHDGRTQVVEQVGEGTDTVRSDVSFVLSANVENLVLMNPGLTGVGNDLANKINGTNGGDVLYGGAGDDTLQGGDGADTLDGGLGGDSMLGGKGDDTYFVDDVRDVVIENANGGHDTIYTSLATYTLGGNLEDLKAASDDGLALTGNTLNNLIVGGAGDDTLDGAAGVDTLVGGDGNDTYYVSNPADQVVEAVGGGYDTVYVSNGAWVLGAGQEVEKLVAVAGTTGMALHGNAFAQTLVGNAGSNLMDGGGGADTLIGGDGGDIYLVDNSAIVIVETATGGNDIVKATVDYVLPDNVETLAFQTAGHTGVGSSGANTLVGSTGSDTLDGAGGNDVLTGGGGADTFRFTPGSGNDTITDFAAGDVIDLSAYLNAGASPTVSWSADGAVIHLTAVDSILLAHVAPSQLTATATGYTIAGTSAGDSTPTTAGTVAAVALNLAGTAGNDSLVGGGANDTIDGGAGADTMVGGGGDDLYFVRDSRDVIVEAAGGGTDSVKAAVSYTLGANVENLLLTGGGHLTGTGNDLANKITGGAGGDALYGGGGADTLLGGDGNDTLDGGTGGDSLLGGKGDDLYVVDSTGDVVIENAGGGNDTVRTNLQAYTLAANVETLVGTNGGGQNLTGNALDNLISGGAGADTLHGGGGNDTLAGGAGNDTYYVELSGEKVVEAPGGGYDTVYVYNGGWSLGAGQEVEKLVAASGTAGIALHGNEFAQTLVGNAGANLMDGGGGADTMIGGAGNDTYIVDNSADVIVENPGEGTDYVQASVNYTLSANIEYLTLTAPGHTGKGNDQANTIVGTSGADTLIGAGGADTLTGGGGADVFTYQHLSDRGDVITDFQVGVDKLNVHDLLAELGGGAHLSFAHTAKGLEVYVDHGAAHDELVLLQGVAGSSLATHDYIV